MMKAIAVWTPSVLLGVLFVMQGIMKLTSVPGWVQKFQEYGYPNGFYLAVGLVELLGGLGLLIPRIARYAALALAAVMFGAAGTHLVAGEMANAGFTFLLMVVFVLLAHARRRHGRPWRVARPTG